MLQWQVWGKLPKSALLFSQLNQVPYSYDHSSPSLLDCSTNYTYGMHCLRSGLCGACACTQLCLYFSAARFQLCSTICSFVQYDMQFCVVQSVVLCVAIAFVVLRSSGCTHCTCIVRTVVIKVQGIVVFCSVIVKRSLFDLILPCIAMSTRKLKLTIQLAIATKLD